MKKNRLTLPLRVDPAHIAVSVSVTRAEINAIARVLNADADGRGYMAGDGESRDAVLLQLIGRAGLQLGPPWSQALITAIDRDHESLGKHPIGPEQFDTPPSSQFVGRASKRQRASRK